MSKRLLKAMLIRACLLFLLVLFGHSAAYGQEFEITLPEDLEGRPQRRSVQKTDAAQSDSRFDGDNKPGSAVRSISDAELFLYRRTYESQSMLIRLERVEKTLMGQVSKGDLKARVAKITDTINGGKVRIASIEGAVTDSAKSTAISSKKENPRRKWWQLFPKSETRVKQKGDPASTREKLLKEGRRYYRQGTWQKASDQFSQVLMLDSENVEALHKQAICRYHICTDEASALSTSTLDARLVSAREDLEKVIRLYSLAGKTEEALDAKKAIEAIDQSRRRLSGGVEDF
ncbi:hypothetical protein GC174_07555 [bacterium]|nr:hypothetical protein [bacterium]